MIANSTQGGGEGFQFVLNRWRPYYFACGERNGFHCKVGRMKFMMHCKGSRHQAAESKMKERELMRRDEINKRIALSNSPTYSVNSSTTKQNAHLASKPLIQMVQKAASEILSEKAPKHNLRN
ncbi:hypothetical protein CRYUN_Cryun18bG0101000 [Craigia yunnanensis]